MSGRSDDCDVHCTDDKPVCAQLYLDIAQLMAQLLHAAKHRNDVLNISIQFIHRVVQLCCPLGAESSSLQP